MTADGGLDGAVAAVATSSRLRGLMLRRKSATVLGKPTVKKVVEANRLLLSELPNLAREDDPARRCWGCGRKCHPQRAHVGARRHGGGIEPENFFLLCVPCHQAHPDDRTRRYQVAWLKRVPSARDAKRDWHRSHTADLWSNLDLAKLEKQMDGKVDRSAGTGCWNWTGATNSAGRPHMTVTGGAVRQKQVLVSHVALKISRRPQTDAYALHGCHNKLCVRVGPDDEHLHWGTQQQNWKEMREAGRSVNGLRRNPRLAARGSQHGSRTRPDAFRQRERAVTREQAEVVRQLAAHGMAQQAIAARLALKQSVVSNILRGRTTRFRAERRQPHAAMADEFVRSHPDGVSTQEVAAAIGQSVGTARATLGRVARTGTIRHVGRKWFPASPT